MGYLYRIKNKVNGKSYIGQTIRPIEKRLEEHQKGNSNYCRLIYRSIKKYGWENFEKDWYECPDEDLNVHEDFLVEMLGTLSPNGYNLREGGGGNGKLSEETRQKMSESQRGKTKSKEHRQKISKAMIEKMKSEEHRQKISEATKGEKHHRSNRVYQYDLVGTFIGSFGSCREAERHMGKDGSGIRKCARGDPKYKTAYGFKWSYVS